VLEALLWAFHNAKSGRCFPSYKKIAEAARCARSTVAEAIKALEDAGVLSWVQRITRHVKMLSLLKILNHFHNVALVVCRMLQITVLQINNYESY
jgi:DNA-binding transcriptional regulator YhcF (GntR family)